MTAVDWAERLEELAGIADTWRRPSADDLRAAAAELRRLQWLPWTHARPDECITWNDGCGCTVEQLEHNIRRAEQAEAEIRRLREALEAIASPAEIKDYGWWTKQARLALRPTAAPESGCTAAAHPIKGATRPTEETSHE